MRAGMLWSALVCVVSIGCGARPTSPPAEPDELAADPDEAEPSVPRLVWTDGSERIDVESVAVAFRVTAPLARFGDAEIGTDACGDRLVHASVVDRRTFEPTDAVLWHAFLRAGCTIPDSLSVSELVVDGGELSAHVSFAEGEVAGDWVVHAVTLTRAHRVVVIVSASRSEAPLFERISDAPGLEAVAGAPARDEHGDGSGRRAVEMIFGALSVVGEISRAFR